MRTNLQGLIIAAVLTGLFVQNARPLHAQNERPTAYKLWGGDLNADGISEIITWDSKSMRFAVWDYSVPNPKELTAHPDQFYPTHVEVADIDGDGSDEIIVGQGLAGYNTPGIEQTDITLQVYRPLGASGWNGEEIFRQASERPQISSLELVNADADPESEIILSYMVSKYQAEVALADRSSGSWKVEKQGNIRMGMHVDAGDVMDDGKFRLVVGRPYGDYGNPPEDTIPVGDAFVLDGTERIKLPVFRGVSSVAVADVDADERADIIVGDGWHRDYGKVARTRIAVIQRSGDQWDYELIEDIPASIRVQNIEVMDLDDDGGDEIIVWASRNRMFEGRVRLYQHTDNGWRGVSLADSVQAFFIGDIDGDKGLDITFAGAHPRSKPLTLAQITWDAELAKEVITNKADPAALVGKPAPEIEGATWIGGESVSLSELKGKVVLLDFWATWCGPCVDAFPTLKKWLQEYGPQGFTIIGMTNHSSQTTADVQKFLKRRPLPWVVPVDPSNRTHLAYGTGNLPHQVLIDREGIVHAFYTGSGETLEQVEADIKLLLAR